MLPLLSISSLHCDGDLKEVELMGKYSKKWICVMERKANRMTVWKTSQLSSSRKLMETTIIVRDLKYLVIRYLMIFEIFLVKLINKPDI